MYAGALPLISAIPIALGSWWGLLVAAVSLPLLIARLLDEEHAGAAGRGLHERSEQTRRRDQMKTVSFSIRPFSEVMGDFAKTFEAVRSGQRIPKGARQEVGFTSIEAARNFLTRERLALLRAFEVVTQTRYTSLLRW
jgi:hypothetical protein